VITSELIEAYLACPLKCYLQSKGEKCAENRFAAWNEAEQESYRLAGVKTLGVGLSSELARDPLDGSQLSNGRWQLALDHTFDVKDLSAKIHGVQRVTRTGKADELIPIRFVHTNKLSPAHRLAAAFDAIVLSMAARKPIGIAKIIHGDAWVHDNVRVAAQGEKLTKLIAKLRLLLAGADPPAPVLNRHCPECEFRDRCRDKAIQEDSLSLLARLGDKERGRLNRKGIFTINQLSYTFRPRRRPKRLAAKQERYHHSLRALALREKRIHVVGKPELAIDGTPIFFDVESIPDRDFHYLVGIRIDVEQQSTGYSLWANTSSDERSNWTEFLAIISTVQDPILIHYGSSETKFLKKMCDRYGPPPEGSIAAKAIASPLNLLSRIFGTVYFPSFSNGLKENARFLGFEWSDTSANGLQAIVWRRSWEHSFDPSLREKLIAYNREDCDALALVTRAVSQLTNLEPGSGLETPSNMQVVHVDAVKLHPQRWKPFKSPISDMEEINLAARWEYQRDRVFVRSGTAKRRGAKRLGAGPQVKRVQKVVCLPAPADCPQCAKRWRKQGVRRFRIVQDFIFSKHSIKRRIVRYEAQAYVCRSCGCEYGLSNLLLNGRDWGWNVVSYFIYHAIGLRIPQLTLQHSINRLFGCCLVRSSLNEFKIKASKFYSDTKANILNRIISGNLIHADETSANIKGQAAYVWVLTSLTDVVYILTESREGETVRQLLKEFGGVLVSDFYTGYDSVNCAQQKCLLHLMRDLNDEILNNPFDEEAKLVALQFAGLLRAIVDTIDARGLRARFLRKHLREVERFYSFLNNKSFESETADRLKRRFNRNRDRLFTFLQYDGVPWNNNNAEHAIKAFARLRDVISGSSTRKGVDEYLTLLSVSETCRYRGVDFLDFLRSGEKDVATFVSSCAPKR
jgi:predicted RecB family nuclease